MNSSKSGHPLPAPPGQPQLYAQQQQQQQQQQRPVGRPRSKSSFSLRSHKSSGSGGKINLTETHAEKEAKRLSTKADPRLAMSELEPSAVASGVTATASPLRAIQHRDANGNPIADPDRSNPTRSRWERPLDTIRAFEAAIDGNYSRQSYARTESADAASTIGMGNRRSSYFGARSQMGGDGPRHGQDSYYGGRQSSYRPDSYMDRGGHHMRPDSYYDNQHHGGHGPSNGYYPQRARYPRTVSESHNQQINTHNNNYSNGGGVYPVQGVQQSYETVTTASGSGSSGEAPGYMTDPSSDNSSIDRLPPRQEPQQPVETYGFSGFGGGPDVSMPISEYGPYGGGQQRQQQTSGGYGGQDNYGPPPVPRKQYNQGLPPVSIKLNSTQRSDSFNEKQARPGTSEKRKSWFGKRFSRS